MIKGIRSIDGSERMSFEGYSPSGAPERPRDWRGPAELNDTSSFGREAGSLMNRSSQYRGAAGPRGDSEGDGGCDGSGGNGGSEGAGGSGGPVRNALRGIGKGLLKGLGFLGRGIGRLFGGGRRGGGGNRSGGG